MKQTNLFEPAGSDVPAGFSDRVMTRIWVQKLQRRERQSRWQSVAIQALILMLTGLTGLVLLQSGWWQPNFPSFLQAFQQPWPLGFGLAMMLWGVKLLDDLLPLLRLLRRRQTAA